jgi:hypothetical protein
MKMKTKTDCRTDEGITVSIIDTIINSFRLLKDRKLTTVPVQQAMLDLYSDEDVRQVIDGDVFTGKIRPKIRSFKDREILTDGKRFIRIGCVLNKNWSYENIYGRKNDEYRGCTAYPVPTDNRREVDGLLVFVDGYLSGNIPGLWFQEGYSLQNFIVIDERLISPEILKKLKNL